MHRQTFVSFLLCLSLSWVSVESSESLLQLIGTLSRQVMMNQFELQERSRSYGDSGVKQLRQTRDGTRNYHSETHTGTRMCAMHDHANNIRTVGMGEFAAVLNGVEFRTRHNDFPLKMPSRNLSDFNEVEDIPFPDVPPEVTSKSTVEEQMAEMRLWFKAWRDQDYSVRDYRQYFKPVLCYLEGAWTNEALNDFEEPFESDRHFLDAKSWFDLQEKIRFTSSAGRKDPAENYAYLPTSIMDIINDTYPQFAQWNYRILCHPLSRDISTKDLRVVDDLASRMGQLYPRTLEAHQQSRAARFTLNPKGNGDFSKDFPKTYGLLDELMAEIPGKDNYQGNITDNAFGETVLNYDTGSILNAARYHHWYKTSVTDAMGVDKRARGFADKNAYMALNTQAKIPAVHMQYCPEDNQCTTYMAKVSYAIPLELIYLTPLSNWNPYELQYKGSHKSTEGLTVEANGRNGGMDQSTAYDGTHSKLYYHTPHAFFNGENLDEDDPADTTEEYVGVLDQNGVVRKMAATGTRIFFPNIDGVGVLRQRYPIMPVHGEGNSMWKELEALKDIVMDSKKYAHMFHSPLFGNGVGGSTKSAIYSVEPATSGSDIGHTHDFVLTPEQLVALDPNQGPFGAEKVEVTTTMDAGHTHTLVLKGTTKWGMTILSFNGTSTSPDGHPNKPYFVESFTDSAR